jgi:hypothetical protein
MTEIILQDLLNEATAGLDATIATQAATIAADAVTIADLEEQLANLPPPDPHPVPSAANTGIRGGLTNFAAGLSTAHDVTIENRSSSTTVGLTLTGANVTLKNCKIASTGSFGLNVENAAGFTAIDGTVNQLVKGAGTFKTCNFASLELTAASIVTDCYIPGGITGSGVAASTITNTTVTVLP